MLDIDLVKFSRGSNLLDKQSENRWKKVAQKITPTKVVLVRQ